MKTVNKPEPKPLGVNGFKHRHQYGIVVVCLSEADRQNSYAQLKALGLKLRVVAV